MNSEQKLRFLIILKLENVVRIENEKNLFIKELIFEWIEVTTMQKVKFLLSKFDLTKKDILIRELGFVSAREFSLTIDSPKK